MDDELHTKICLVLRQHKGCTDAKTIDAMLMAADIIEKQDNAIREMKETVFKSCVELLKCISEYVLKDSE